ncbi:unnamed protein product [Cladocopium goreaui]|uniref:Uncharacterized protein n=1 Tax=Cladocopium goreaui TaxID=2562237 RepID=A0A9P1BVC9_9DINO|nr:unnamed protein product [Cladocopium goreaui]
MKRELSLFAVLLLTFSAVCWLGPHGQPSRRLLSLSVAFNSVEVDWTLAGQPEEDFERWMSNGGLSHDVTDFRGRLAVRILAFAVDVLPESIKKDYAEDLAEVQGVDPSAKRPLTWTEELIKDALATQALHGENLTAMDYKYFRFLPKFIGRVLPGQSALGWSSRCWKEVSASVEKLKDKWQLHVKVSKAQRLICNEVFGLFTASHFRIGSFSTPIGGQKTFTFEMGLTEPQTWDVDNLGVRIFAFHENALATMRSVLDTALLFAPLHTKGVAPLAAQRNVDFLEKYMGIEMKRRVSPPGDQPILNESQIHSGDFIGVIRLDGLDPVLAFGMGSHTGHTAVALWEDGQLYIAESTVNGSYWPTNGIQRTPYRQWMAQAKAAGFSVVHAPLREEYRKMFSERGANDFYHRYEGLEYGYHALFTGWIDTTRGNYPCMPPYNSTADKICLVWELLEVGVPIVTRYIPRLEKPFLLAWNQHVTGSAFSNLSGTALYREALSKGMELDLIPAVPEPDGVLYPSDFNNGTQAPSIAMVCDVFVCSIWKAAGLFKEIDDDFSCIEQTNLDVYQLNILEAPKQRPASCVAADPDNALCQLTGDYELHLPKLGQRSMYRHMQEKCPTEPPLYARPSNC